MKLLPIIILFILVSCSKKEDITPSPITDSYSFTMQGANDRFAVRHLTITKQFQADVSTYTGFRCWKYLFSTTDSGQYYISLQKDTAVNWGIVYYNKFYDFPYFTIFGRDSIKGDNHFNGNVSFSDQPLSCASQLVNGHTIFCSDYKKGIHCGDTLWMRIASIYDLRWSNRIRIILNK